MTKRVKLCVLIVVLISTVIAVIMGVFSTKKESVVWESYYDIGSEEGSFVLIDKDLIISTGYTDFNKNKDALLLCFTKNGKRVFDRRYGGASDDTGKIIISLEDGYLIIGSTTSYGKNGSMDAWLVKVDKDGNEIWNRSYGGKFTDLFNDVIIDGDRIVAVGHSEQGEDKWYGLFVITDDNGNKILEKEVESEESTGLSSVITLNGFYYAIGYEGVFGSGRDDLLLLKFDKNGNIVWKKLFGGKFEDAGVWLCGENDYLYLVGYKDRNGDSNYDFWIFKFKIH